MLAFFLILNVIKQKQNIVQILPLLRDILKFRAFPQQFSFGEICVFEHDSACVTVKLTLSLSLQNVRCRAYITIYIISTSQLLQVYGVVQ